MTLHSRFLPTLVGLTLAGVALTGCSGPAPVPTPTFGAAGGVADTADGDSGAGDGAVTTGTSGLEQAAADGMPALGISGCPQLDTYEYSPSSGNTVWHFVFTCTSRNAFDATTESLVGSGYELRPLVISEGQNVSERNYLQADANGGSTEVQLNLTGSPDELEFEIFVTLTLP